MNATTTTSQWSDTVQIPKISRRWWCAVCRHFCANVFLDRNIATAELIFIFECHGKTETVKVPELLQHITDLPNAFRAERDEIDRLANEDAALAAVGLADAVDERLAVEDVALGAIVMVSPLTDWLKR